MLSANCRRRARPLRAQESARMQGAWADRYRKRWTWDRVTWGSHAVDCYPGGCPWRVYTRDGKIVREEQAGTFPAIEPGIPDMNPMGCQKGACWSHCHYSPDPVPHPPKRGGERGEGKFERVSWDQALTEIADGILDALQTSGPASILNLFTPEPGRAPPPPLLPPPSPSPIHADHHLPVRIGTDAALALAMCKVIIDAGLHKKQFVQELTDLPLLVRTDTGRFLRGSDLAEGDRDDQFFWWDAAKGALTPAPRGTLALAGRDPALAGRFPVMLKDLRTIEVEPVFARLRRHLEDYTPERAGEICQVHPDNIRKLARKVATRKTKIFIGWNSGKYYHGDLMERALAPLLGITGNWCKKGTGTRSWAVSGMDGEIFLPAKQGPGQEAAQRHIAGMIAMRRLVGASDPTLTEEMISNRMMQLAGDAPNAPGFPMPPAFLWYYPFGYKDRWNDPENHDPSFKRSFDDYVNEAIEKGWWDPRYAKVYRDVQPRVLFEAGGNVLRRQRGGQKLLLEHVWPKLELIVSVDYRITTTGLHSDYILPAAQHYEKLGHSMPSVHHLNYVLCDRAAPPLGEALPDLEIGFRVLEKIEERAAIRGMTEFVDMSGRRRSLRGLVDAITFEGALRDEEKRADEAIRDSAVYGILPEGTTLETLREKGAVRWTNWGMVLHGTSQASTIRPDEVHNPLRWHTEDKVPYDTLVRRAQYYIDHEWFLEAGEELPTHKERPAAGGAGRRFQMTSGQNRWSIHSMNMTNNIIQNTHRGTPFAFLNDRDAAQLG